MSGEVASILPGVSEAATASATLRSTAKWLATAFAAAGGVLIGGLQFSSIGEVPWPFERVVAIVAIAIALMSVGRAIWAATTVLTAEHMTLQILAREPSLDWLREFILDRTSWMCGRDRDLSAFCVRHEKLVARRNEAWSNYATAYEEYLGTSPRPVKAPLHGLVDIAEQRLAESSHTAQQIVATAEYEHLRQRFVHARCEMFQGAAIAAVALGVFGIVGHTPPADRLATPKAVELWLTQEGQMLLDHAAGPSCVPPFDAPSARAIALANLGGGAWDVVTIPVPSCQTPLRFTLSPAIGTLVQGPTAD